MMEMYTPQQWMGPFGECPKLVINDEGFIYDGRAYQTQLGPQPIGRINWEQGFVYGADYASVWPQPVGYIRKDGEVTKLYAEAPGLMVSPVLYIRDGKVYTDKEYNSIWPVEAAVIREDKPAEEKPAAQKPAENTAAKKTSSGHGGGKFALIEVGVIIFIVLNFRDLLEKNPPLFAYSVGILAYMLPLGSNKVRMAVRGKLMADARTKKNALICAALGIVPLACLGGWCLSSVNSYSLSIWMIYVVPMVLAFFYLIYRAVANLMADGDLPQWPFK